MPALLAAACGPAGPTVDVRLITGLENPARFANLMKGLSTAAMTGLGAMSCRQPHLFAGLDMTPDNGDDDALLETYPLNLSANYTATGNFTVDALWLQNNTAFDPVTIPVPRGVPVGIGLIGSFIATGGEDAADRCVDFDNSANAYHTYTISGHRRWVADTAGDVPLNVFVTRMDALPSATPAQGLPGDPRCEDESRDAQFCPTLNYYEVSCSGSGCPSLRFKFEYGFGRNRPEHVVQWLNGMPVASKFNIPDVMPLRIGVYNNPPGSAELDFQEIRRADFSDGPLPVALTRNLFSSAQIKILERPRKLPAALGSLALAPLGYDGSGYPMLSWSLPPNFNSATRYEVRWDTTSRSSALPPTNYLNSLVGGLTSTSHSMVTTPFIAGGTYFLRVYATDGISISSSGQMTYVPIALPAFGLTSLGSGSVTFTWNLPAGSSTSMNYLKVYRSGTAIQVVPDIAASYTGTFSATFNRPPGDAANTSYDFQIYAKNATGSKAYSTINTVSVP